MRSRLCSIIAVSLALAGCQTAAPSHYRDLASSSVLVPNAGTNAERVPFAYGGTVDWSGYTGAVVEPVVIYSGADNQFGDMSAEDRKTLADYMYARFTQQLATRFSRATPSAPNTLRIRLTLTGAVKNTPVLGTFSRIDVAGLVYNGIQTARDGEGSFTGAVMYAVEIYDARTNRLLSAFVGKQFPKPSDIGASVGDLAAAKAGIDKGAEDLAARLQ
ncbi:DUF3313 domain-containing protein [Ancylobacter sp. WKF20]|uniref:DUF3313 domain-containing protein n=1 Tax=Ancylobacter sp. WKF20 TaxID=3039801 RepID=UPI00243439B9|nr:DUF3313 domain-containing protein [Ancylobacter sp. WKF20]WGD32245.1 DUF3313 domain-containing protein [Ancylobacter sp. WKF20]